jgi:hypothetical protein
VTIDQKFAQQMGSIVVDIQPEITTKSMMDSHEFFNLLLELLPARLEEFYFDFVALVSITRSLDNILGNNILFTSKYTV